MNNFYSNLTEVRDKVDKFLRSLDATIELGRQIGINITPDVNNSFVGKSESPKAEINEHALTFKKGPTLKDSVLNALMSKERFVKGKDIAQDVAQYFPEKHVDMESFRLQVSGLLSLLKKEGKIAKYNYSNSKKDSVWGKLEWLDLDGKPIENREYIIEYK